MGQLGRRKDPQKKAERESEDGPKKDKSNAEPRKEVKSDDTTIQVRRWQVPTRLLGDGRGDKSAQGRPKTFRIDQKYPKTAPRTFEMTAPVPDVFPHVVPTLG